MIVTLKTLQQQTFKIEIDSEETVKALKEKVEKEKGAETFPAAGQKLIYAGKILDDEKPISFYKIEEKNFVVVMVTKPKPVAQTAPAPAPAPTTTAAETPATTVTTPSASETKPASEPPKAEEKSETPSNTSSSTDATVSESNLTAPSESTASVTSDLSTTSAESALVTGQMYEDAVAQIVNMGFDREQVQRAMRASFNNPDRAVEYLFNGIPDMPRDEPPPAAPNTQGSGRPAQQQSAPAPTGTTPAQGTAPAPATGAPAQAPASGTGTTASGPGQLTGPPPGSQLSGEETLAFLRNQPQFQHMRTLLQQNPALLPELLQQIGRSNPTLLQMISQNQEQFIAMLNEQGDEPAEQQGVVGGGGGRSPGQGVIHVTQEEKEAIDRLKDLGFPEGLCIQAYFACEKNEELAANYLISHAYDDDES